MQRVLKGVPEQPVETPDGVVSLRINADSGLRDDARHAVRLVLLRVRPAPRGAVARPAAGAAAAAPPQDVRNQLF